MNDAKYIGLDVHQATISAAILDATGRFFVDFPFYRTGFSESVRELSFVIA